MKLKIKLLSLLFISSNCLAAAEVTTHINSVSGNHGYNFTVTSNHNYHIVNDTDSSQRYDVYFQLCAQNKGCVNNNIPVILAPHAEVKDVFTSHHYVNYKNAGSYSSSASTQVDGESKTAQNTSGSIQVY